MTFECHCVFILFLVINGQCRIERGSPSAVGTPTFNGQPQTTYSCVADENCNYDVHVIGNYEGNGHTGFRVHNTGNTDVNISISGQGTKPLVLVFVSYEPVNWILDIPSTVTIDKVLLVSKINMGNTVYLRAYTLCMLIIYRDRTT